MYDTRKCMQYAVRTIYQLEKHWRKKRYNSREIYGFWSERQIIPSELLNTPKQLITRLALVLGHATLPSPHHPSRSQSFNNQTLMFFSITDIFSRRYSVCARASASVCVRFFKYFQLFQARPYINQTMNIVTGRLHQPVAAGIDWYEKKTDYFSVVFNGVDCQRRDTNTRLDVTSC